MKKIFFLAVAATAMLAACNKTEVVPVGEAQEISFVAVNKTATKTPVEGNVFKEGDNMAVAAYIVEGASTPGDFFAYTQFSKATGETYWTGNPARYWPLTSSTINFLAVTETGGDVDNTNVTFPGTNYASSATVTLANNAVFNQNDLMYAAGQGSHTQGGAYTAVSMVFKHALSWINFQVSKADADGYDLVVNSIKLNGAKYNGTLNLSNGQYNENSAQTTERVEATWTPDDKVDAVQVPDKNGNGAAPTVTLTTSYQLFGNGLLVVPGYADSFTINYTLTQEGGTANTYDYTYTLPAGATWEMAKKYFYNISFDLTEIEVNPSVTDWDASHVGVNSGVGLN